jgi:hypothetical protein
LTGLQSCTVYYFEVESTDPAGNTAVSDNNGGFYRFETKGDFGAGLQPCHDGQVTVLSPIVDCADSFPIQLIDLDLNSDPLVADTVQITVTSSTETTGEMVTLTETQVNTSVFTGSIATSGGPPASDGVLQTADGDVITATYMDLDDGTGAGGFDFDTGVADCAGPGVTSVQVLSVGDDTAEVRFTTSEATTGSVDWGTTPSLGSIASSPTLKTTHTVVLSPLLECGRAYFRVHAQDQYGNAVVSDASGSPYEFNAGEIGGALFKDGFETDTGWDLDGEWEMGVPQGLGSSPGDPAAAFAGGAVLGHDLSGLGANPGDYEPNTTEYATSPRINTSSLSTVELKIRRWLNLGPGGLASIEAKQGNTWYQVWVDGDSQEDTSWLYQTVDISAYAAGNNRLEIRFKQWAGFGGLFDAGWNVDRFVVRDGTQPEFVSCGGCAGAPTFGGATSAVDNDPCGDTGVVLGWTAAPSWGTGGGGTYAVYRSTDPGFVPSAGNLVASGVAGTSYVDAGAPNDQVLYYVVRAESDETCSTGPNNGGVEEQNLVRLPARDDTSQLLPPSVGETLMAVGVNHAHVLLSWGVTPDAASYRVHRSQQPDSGFGQLADVVETSFEDENQYAEPPTYFYLVGAADSCGNEGP